MSVVFYILATLTVAGALAAVLLKNTVHCALALTVAFAGLALLFLNLDAQFAGFAQILVYIGAVAILVVFAILLTKGSETPADGVFSRTWLAGLAIAAAVFAVLGWAVIQTANLLPNCAPTPTVTVQQIGQALVTVEDGAVSADDQCPLAHRLRQAPVALIGRLQGVDLLAVRPGDNQGIDLAAADGLQRLLGFGEPRPQALIFRLQSLHILAFSFHNCASGPHP